MFKRWFSLSITELMVDAITGYRVLSFIDGPSGYNQIWMNPKYEELTLFHTSKGIYCYKNYAFWIKKWRDNLLAGNTKDLQWHAT